MKSADRNSAWKEIWVKKGLERNAPLHHADGFDLLSAEEWDCMIAQVTRPIGLRGNESVLECGCGAGAFLESLLNIHPGLVVSGIDYAPSLVARARERLNGVFVVADITDLGFLAGNTYDLAASFGVFLYLSSEDAARRAVREMLRVTKPGGRVYIGEVSDETKRGEAERIRRTSHLRIQRLSRADPDHLYLAKTFFKDFARGGGAVDVRIIDHSQFDLGYYPAARYRYSVYMTKGPPRST